LAEIIEINANTNKIFFQNIFYCDDFLELLKNDIFS